MRATGHESGGASTRQWLESTLRFPGGLRLDTRVRTEMLERWYRFRVVASGVTILTAAALAMIGFTRSLAAVTTAVLVLAHAVFTRNRPQLALAIILDTTLSFLTLEVLGVPTAVMSLLYVCYGVITLLLAEPRGRFVVGVALSAVFAMMALVDLSDPAIPGFWSQVAGITASLVFVMLLVGTISVAIEILQRHVHDVDETNRRLDAMIHSKDALISTMSHELRTPLTAVLGFAAQLHDGWALMDEQERRHLASLIASEGESMAQLTEDMAVATRVELGTLTIRPEAVPLVATVTAFLDSCRLCAGSVETVGGSVAVDVTVDPLRLQQVLRALAGNAKRYGGERVWVEFDSTPEVGLVRICDDGPGIADERLDHVFLPFERAHENPTQPGTLGLGLAMAKRVTEAMNGTITYIRRSNATVFELALPRATDPTDVSVEAAASA